MTSSLFRDTFSIEKSIRLVCYAVPGSLYIRQKAKGGRDILLPFAFSLLSKMRTNILVTVNTPHIACHQTCMARAGKRPHYERLLRYEWSDPSLMGSLMMMSPLRIFMLYKQEGLVQTQALYSIEAPWLPKSESGTRSPSLHLRQRGKAFSTKSPPSFSLEDNIRLPSQASEEVSRGRASAA